MRVPQQRWIPLLILLAATNVWGQDADQDPAGSTQPDGNRVSGTLSDPAGEAVSGAVIWVRVGDQYPSAKYKHDDWFDPVSTETDEAGRFSFVLSASGPYVLHALHPDHPPLNVVEVLDGRPVELAFLPVLAHSGEVRGKDGTPLEGADVLACGKGAEHFGDHACLRTRSGAEGDFVFDRLSAGRFRFQAWAPGKTLSPGQSRKFPLEERETPALVLELGPGAEVSGTLADDTGNPVPGVRVYFQSDRVRLRQTRSATDIHPLTPNLTDGDGNFTFAGLPVGEPLKLFASVEQGAAAAESKTVTLEPGSVMGGVSIVFNRPASAIVRVIDADEQPVDALDVLWRPVKEGKSSGANGFRIAGFRAGTEIEALGEGRFSIKKIKPDHYDVTLLPSMHQEISLEGIRVSPGTEVDLGTHVARPGATLAGYIVDDLGAPVAGAKLEGMYLHNAEALSRSVTSDEDGHFVLGGLGDGPLLWVKIQAKGHATKTEQRVVADRSDYEVVLDRVGTVSGRILLDSGDSPVGSEARLERTAGGMVAFRRNSQPFAQGDQEGYFEIADATPGTYTLRLSAKDVRALRVKDVVVSPGEATDVGTHRLEPGLEIAGMVLDRRDGSPVAGAGVTVSAAGGSLLAKNNKLNTAMTDSDGNFVVAGLSSGRLTIEVDHADYAPAKLQSALQEDQAAAELVVHLGQGGMLRGTVKDETGTPSADRVLGIMEGSGFVPQDDFVRTNEAGEYRVERMRPGAYRIMLYADPTGNTMDVQQKNATIREDEETVVDFGGRSKIAFEGLLTRGGRPVGEVLVMLVPSNPGGAIQTRNANTDLSGRFEVGLDSPGAYSVIVQDLDQGVGVLVGQAKIVVPDEPSVSLEISLEAGAISGNVTDATGQPIDGAVVSAIREGANLNEIGSGSGAMVGAGGTYSLEGMHEGTYTVSAIADGYEMDSRSVTLSGSTNVDGVDFRLEIAGTLTGRVVDVNGNGIAGALVFASPASAPEGVGGVPTEADTEGLFRVSSPGPGACDITAVARGFAPGRLSGYVPTPDVEGPGAVVTLTTGGTIAIRVVDAEGRPKDAIQPVVQSDRPSQITAIAMMLAPIPLTDATGSSVVVNLPEGSYRVSLAGHPEVPAQPVSVGDGGKALVTLQLP